MKEFELTPRPQNTYPKGGDIFMDNKDFVAPQESSLIRRPDSLLNFSPKSSEAVFLSESLKRSGLSGIKKSELRGELVRFAEEFTQKAEDRPLLNPFENWNNDRLRNEYLGLLGVQSKIQKDTSFEEAEKFSGKMRAYHARLIDELSRRGIDTSELFLHAAQKSEEGNEIRSIGAATITDHFTDRILQSIVNEINEEIRQKGEGNPLDLDFIMQQLAQVYNRRNMDDLPPEIILEAENLVGILNDFRREKKAAIEIEQQRNAAGERRRRISPEELEYENKKLELFSNETIRAEFANENPDFTYLNGRAEMRALTDFFEKNINPSNQSIIDFATILATAESGQPIEEYDGLVFSEASRKVLFEWLIEKIISIPDSTPESHYNIGSFQIQNVKDSLLMMARNSFEPDFSRYLQELTRVREMSHELNISFKHGESYKKFIIEGLNARGIDFLQNELTGVHVIIDLYEKVAAQKVWEKRTWLDAKDVYEIDVQVVELVNRLHENGKLTTKSGRKLTNWEKQRSIRLGKILFAGKQRMAMYVGQGDLPPDLDLSGRIASVPYEFIVRSLVPQKIIGARFFMDRGQRRYMEVIADEIEKTGDYVGLFGLDKKTIMFNNSGAYDPESHSWRSMIMFLANINLEENDGSRKTLLNYLTEKAIQHGGAYDPLFGGGDLSGVAKEQFSSNVEDFVLGQRLYLSALSRYGNFDKDLKTKIWQKIASFKPSTIVALLPENVLNEGERPLWDSLRSKLFLAEEIRVLDDARNYDNAQTELQLREEAARFRSGAEKYAILDYFSEENGNSLTEVEEVLLRSIIDRGYNNANRLATAVMPFAYCIDDAPKISWNKSETGQTGMSQEDLLRLLASDHESLAEAWGSMNNHIESPASGFIELISKAVDKYAVVHGREGAQDKFEPYIIAYMKMAATDEWTVWTPGAMSVKRLMKKPTSEMERYFRGSFISMDEDARANTLQALVQVKAIGDNPKRLKEGLTQLDLIRKKTKSNNLALFLRMLRLVIFLMGPEAGIDLMKSVFPAEASKVFGK